MSEPNIPKTQEEWLEHFKELGRKHGEMLAQPFIDYFADKILLTKKEVEEARREAFTMRDAQWPVAEFYNCFWGYCRDCEPIGGPVCRLCKKLTQFVKGGEGE